MIGSPVRIQAGRGEHTCLVTLTGLVTWEVQIYGASALQAAELAIVAVRMRLASMEHAWKFFDRDGTSVSFGWTLEEALPTK